jgi:hypothetical protein
VVQKNVATRTDRWQFAGSDHLLRGFFGAAEVGYRFFHGQQSGPDPAATRARCGWTRSAFGQDQFRKKDGPQSIEV